MSEPELTDLSLLILADLGVKPTRNQQRVNTLTQDLLGGNYEIAPASVRALEAAGLLTIRKTGTGKNYKLEISDKGLALHRHLIALLRQAATELPLPPPATPDAELRWSVVE
jgi:hypothetical protein